MTGLRLTVEPQPRLLAFAADVQGIDRWPDDADALGVIREIEGTEPEIIAVAVFCEKRIHDCQIHVATDGSRRFLNRNILGGVFAYAFFYKGYRRLTGEVPAHNISAQILNLKLGFVFEGRKTLGRPDGTDAIVMGMTAEACPWINEGKEISDGRL